MSGIANLKERVRAAETRLKDAVEARERGTSELSEMWQLVRDRFVEKDGELAGFRDQFALKDKELAEQRDRISQQEAQIEAFREQVARQEAQLEEFQERAARHDDEVAELHKRTAQQNKEITGFQAQIAAKDAEISALQNRIEEQSSDIAAHDSQIAALNDQIKSLTEQNRELSASLEALLASVEHKINVPDPDPMAQLGDQMKGLVTGGGVADIRPISTGPVSSPAAASLESAPHDIDPMDAIAAVNADQFPGEEVAVTSDMVPPDFGAPPEVLPEETFGSRAVGTPPDPMTEMSVGDMVATVQASHDNIAGMGGMLQDALGQMGAEESVAPEAAAQQLPEPAIAEKPVQEAPPPPLDDAQAEPSEFGIRRLMSRLSVTAKAEAVKKKSKRPAVGRPQRKSADAEEAAEMDGSAQPDAPEPAEPENALTDPEPKIEPVAETVEETTEPQAETTESMGAQDEDPDTQPAEEESDPHLAEELEEIESLRSGLTGLRDKISS